jgi:hypothetical protein
MTEVKAVLPKDIEQEDLKYPPYEENDEKKREENRIVATFDMWYTNGLGWVIPTLLIRHSRRSDRSDRTYATTLIGEACRVGLGPHVLARHTVYVKASRKQALQKYLDLQLKGQQQSNEIRDRISTRRARTALRRQGWGF